MAEDHDRRDISDHAWSLLEPELRGRRGSWGGMAPGSRRTAGREQCPPPLQAAGGTGVWERLRQKLADEPGCEWLMSDSIRIKVHPAAAGAVGGNQAM